MSRIDTWVFTSMPHRARNILEFHLHINPRECAIIADRRKVSSWMPYPGVRVIFIAADAELEDYIRNIRMPRQRDPDCYTVESYA